jgi:hypothetical protein
LITVTDEAAAVVVDDDAEEEATAPLAVVGLLVSSSFWGVDVRQVFVAVAGDLPTPVPTPIPRYCD